MSSHPTCAVVTGAASGIGRGIAYALAARGINLVLSDIDDAGLHSVGSDIARSAPSITVRHVVADVSDPHRIDMLCERAFAAIGRVDWLYNCAGILVSGPSWEFDEDAWKRVLDINLWSAIRTARAFVPRMIAQGSGHIVNISSLAGLLVGPWLAPYTVSKHGMVALSESMQQEFIALGLPLTMSIVCPGPVQTNIFNHLARQSPESPVAHANQYLCALGESGMTPEQLAQIVLDGVDAKKLWIFPHAEVLRTSLRSRMEILLAAE